MWSRVVIAVALAGCGDDAVTKIPEPPDAASDASTLPPRIATGVHLVSGNAAAGGITSDGYLAFYDFDGDGHSVAKVMPLAGGAATAIATSAGTGKQDVRFEVHGGVVFAWTDRGNRVGDLTIWSAATGAVHVGPNVRPGRAAATADGAYVLYERDVTATTASLVAGPIAGTHAVLATANAEDLDCWQDTDLAAVGDRLFARFCPTGGTVFGLSSYATAGGEAVLSLDAPDAVYGARVVWRTGAGELRSALPDGTGAVTLASGVVEQAVARDGAAVAYRTSAGAIGVVPADGSAVATTLVASGAAKLGALSPDHGTVLYATQAVDKGDGFVQPYYDVIAARAAGTLPIVAGPTSCPGCLANNFTSDGTRALVLDPIDNSEALDAAGTVRVVDLASGTTVASFGSSIYQAIAIARAPGFLYLGAVRENTHEGDWIYTLTERGTGTSDPTLVVADGAAGLVLDAARTALVVSFAPSTADDAGGIWYVPLGQ